MKAFFVKRGSMLLPLFFLLIISCAYFNTFYNAQYYYKKAFKEDGSVNNSDMDKAIEKAGKLIRDYPNSKYIPQAMLIMGNGFFYKREYTNAIMKYQEIINYFKNNKVYCEALFMLGKTYYVQEGYSIALNYFEKGISECKGNWKDSSYVYLVKTLYNTDREKTYVLIDSLINKNPRMWPLYSIKVDKYIEKCEEDSLKYIVSMIKRFPEDIKFNILWKLFNWYISENKLGRSEDILNKMKDIKGKESYVIYSDFILSMKKGIVDMSKFENKEKELSKLPDSLYLDFKLKEGRIYFDKGEFEKSKKIYNDLLKKYRNDKMKSYVKFVELAESLKSDTVDSISRKDEFLFKIAEILWIDIKDIDKSLDYYSRVYDSFPDSRYAPLSLLASGFILINEKHDTLKGVNLLNRLIKNYPKSEKTIDAKKLLKRMGYE